MLAVRPAARGAVRQGGTVPEDHFSRQAQHYARVRPRYPAALFAHVAALAPGTAAAWDCATGNGQAAIGLAAHFATVAATDLSARQIAHATPHPRVRYSVAPAEASGLPDRSADAITVATAAHWLDLDAFYAEARRVGRPGAVLAMWSYYGQSFDPPFDASAAQRLHAEILDAYWPPGNRLAAGGYDDLPFPFVPLPWPAFETTAEWTLADFLSYLRSWSASQAYLADRGEDPVARVAGELTAAWGDRPTRTARWALFGRAGRIA